MIFCYKNLPMTLIFMISTHTAMCSKAPVVKKLSTHQQLAAFSARLSHVEQENTRLKVALSNMIKSGNENFAGTSRDIKILFQHNGWTTKKPEQPATLDYVTVPIVWPPVQKLEIKVAAGMSSVQNNKRKLERSDSPLDVDTPLAKLPRIDSSSWGQISSEEADGCVDFFNAHSFAASDSASEH